MNEFVDILTADLASGSHLTTVISLDVDTPLPRYSEHLLRMSKYGRTLMRMLGMKEIPDDATNNGESSLPLYPFIRVVRSRKMNECPIKAGIRLYRYRSDVTLNVYWLC